ncbi:MAG: type II toxin-antitoxin system RelE/ParE family toxin [Ruminococcus sp.]|nr:type II toxin-antitoxin system RelE/ParE family toxin [Ruminococcus sp.]
MSRLFVMMPSFDNEWKHLGLTDDDLRRLQSELADNPFSGDIIRGTYGCRKCRIPIEERGKRGGGRVIYVDFIKFEKIYLLAVYSKNEQENLTKSECENIRNMVKELETAERTEYERRLKI